MCYKHDLNPTGRRIKASFTKREMMGLDTVVSAGDEAICRKCGGYFIIHEIDLRMAEVATELELSA